MIVLDFMDMMLMQNAQLHQLIMQQTLANGGTIMDPTGVIHVTKSLFECLIQVCGQRSKYLNGEHRLNCTQFMPDNYGDTGTSLGLRVTVVNLTCCGLAIKLLVTIYKVHIPLWVFYSTILFC